MREKAPPTGEVADGGIVTLRLVAVFRCEPAEDAVFAQPLVDAGDGESSGHDSRQRGHCEEEPVEGEADPAGHVDLIWA